MKTLAFMLVALVIIAPTASDADDQPADSVKAIRVFVDVSEEALETMKRLSKRCPQLTVTIAQEKADYVLLMDDIGDGGATEHVAVFDRQRDMIYVGSASRVANAIKDACDVMTKASP